MRLLQTDPFRPLLRHLSAEVLRTVQMTADNTWLIVGACPAPLRSSIHSLVCQRCSDMQRVPSSMLLRCPAARLRCTSQCRQHAWQEEGVPPLFLPAGVRSNIPTDEPGITQRVVYSWSVRLQEPGAGPLCSCWMTEAVQPVSQNLGRL